MFKGLSEEEKSRQRWKGREAYEKHMLIYQLIILKNSRFRWFWVSQVKYFK
jgi:hypothetical protein